MSTPYTSGDPLLDSACEHVLTPVETAIPLVEDERAEVEAEHRAWTRFGDRVAGFETVPPDRTRSRPGTRTTVVGSRPKDVERLRNAFRETVASVDHYHAVYDEPLVEHATRELSAELAAGFRSETSPGFTQLYKAALTTGIGEAIDRRETLDERLRSEQRSLERCQCSLAELLSTADGLAVGVSGPGAVPEELDELASERQRAIQRDYPGSRADGHDLCQYLYAECDWTYPVLTAVARFRDTMV